MAHKIKGGMITVYSDEVKEVDYKVLDIILDMVKSCVDLKVHRIFDDNYLIDDNFNLKIASDYHYTYLGYKYNVKDDYRPDLGIKDQIMLRLDIFKSKMDKSYELEIL